MMASYLVKRVDPFLPDDWLYIVHLEKMAGEDATMPDEIAFKVHSPNIYQQGQIIPVNQVPSDALVIFSMGVSMPYGSDDRE